MKKVLYIIGIIVITFNTNVFAQDDGTTLVFTDKVNPDITSDPVDPPAVCQSTGTAVFTVTVNGDGITYRWQEFTSSWNNLSNGGVYSGVLTSTLTLTSPTAAMDGRQYRCVVSGDCTPSATSAAATLDINLNVAISVQPSNQTACEGSATQFAVTVTGFSPTYQWQIYSGAWTNLTDAGVYSNTTAATLDIADATGLSGKQYRCIITGGCGNSVTTSPAILTVNTLPAITVNPSDPADVCEGAGTATFTVAASGTNITYQWQEDDGSWDNITNGGVYSGATSANLTITNPIALLNGYNYRCVVTGTCAPAATSASAMMTVNSAPVINDQPDDQTICASSSTSFTIGTTLGAPTYMWKLNKGSGFVTITDGTNADGVIITGANTATVTLDDVLYSYNAAYIEGFIIDPTTGCQSQSIDARLYVNPIPNLYSKTVDGVTCTAVNDTIHRSNCTSAGGYATGLGGSQNGVLYEMVRQSDGQIMDSYTGTTGGAAFQFIKVPAGDYEIQSTVVLTGCTRKQ